MGRIGADQIVRKLDEAEGYLMLELPEKALEILTARDDWSTMKFEASFLTGEALRALDRYREALVPLEAAAKLRPGDLSAAMALGWCYKRTQRLAQAIDALERAVPENLDEPLLHYNLACYWSLAGDSTKAVESLEEAFDLDPDLRDLAATESDFDPIRSDRAFGRLVAGEGASN